MNSNERAFKSADLKKIIFLITFVLIVVLTILSFIIPIGYIKWNSFERFDIILYAILVLIPLVILAIFGTRSILQNSKRKKLALIYFYVAMIFIYVFTLIYATWKTNDYNTWLSEWYAYYESHSLKDSLYNIIDVSNYTPAYNYFLILMAKLGFTDLYGIKLVTYLFSFLLAFAVAKIVSTVNKTKFNYLVFITTMILPMVLIEYTAWGQCDAIYTSFALLSFYFALNKKSKLSFMFLGISFAFKLQFLFIVPILFVMLIIKDENGEHYLKWKDIWIVPLMYVINLIPVLAGRSPLDLILVYFTQSTEDNRLAGDCANICEIYVLLGARGVAYAILMVLHFIITAVVLTLLLVFTFKTYKKRGLTKNDLVYIAMLFAFSMVFFMPKMLDRFFFIALMLSVINAFVNRDKTNILIATFMNFAVWVGVCHSFMLFLKKELLLNITMSIAIILNFVTFSLIIYNTVKKYKINSQDKNLEIDAQDGQERMAK